MYPFTQQLPQRSAGTKQPKTDGRFCASEDFGYLWRVHPLPLFQEKDGPIPWGELAHEFFRYVPEKHAVNCMRCCFIVQQCIN